MTVVHFLVVKDSVDAEVPTLESSGFGRRERMLRDGRLQI